MHEKIAIKLANQIAQLNYDNTVLQVQNEEKDIRIAELEQLLDDATKGDN